MKNKILNFITFDYDKENDVLNLHFQKPEKCKCYDSNGVVIRKTLENKLNGITIIDFAKKIGYKGK